MSSRAKSAMSRSRTLNATTWGGAVTRRRRTQTVRFTLLRSDPAMRRWSRAARTATRARSPSRLQPAVARASFPSRRADRIEGRVVDTSGKPVAGVMVNAEAGTDMRRVENGAVVSGFKAVTSTAGAFEIGGLGGRQLSTVCARYRPTDENNEDRQARAGGWPARDRRRGRRREAVRHDPRNCHWPGWCADRRGLGCGSPVTQRPAG